MGTLSKTAVAVTVAVAASVLAAAPAGAQTGGFGDVAKDAYYSQPFDALASQGAFIGTECGDGLFCPGEPIDRKTMAVWTIRVLTGQDPPLVSESRFGDVDARGFYAPFIERMAEIGITRGCGDGSGFCPDRNVTRAQMAAFLSRAYHLGDGPDPGFSDVGSDEWYAADVARLAASGITVGCEDGTLFCPDRNTSRAQMATFLHRAENRITVTTPVEVPSTGAAVAVPAGGSFTAQLPAVTIDAPAGALSADATVSLSETIVGTRGVAEGEKLATAPVALSVAGAEFIRPLTLRFNVDTSTLTPTGAVPAWWSEDLGAWVPLDVESVVIGDGVVTVKATLADARPISATPVSAATVYAGPAEHGASPRSIHARGAAFDFCLLSCPIIVGLIITAVVGVGVAIVALTSETVHDALKEFFGLDAAEPECVRGLPDWVRGVSDTDDDMMPRIRARLHTCGDTESDDLRVRVVNNRNYGIELDAAEGHRSVTIPGGGTPTELLEIGVKEAAEALIGGSYLWPLSESHFDLPRQRSDWTANWRPTGKTALVDGVRIGIDLLKIVLPAIEEANDLELSTCLRDLVDATTPSDWGDTGIFDLSNDSDWTKMLNLVATCFIVPERLESQLSDTLRDGVAEVNRALKWTSTAATAAEIGIEWGLTAADAIKDKRRPPAIITVNTNTLTAQQFTAVSAGGSHSCGITNGGAVTCWGDNSHGQTDAPTGRFTAVSAGRSHSCGITSFRAVVAPALDGAVVTCWGYNSHGQTDAPTGRFTAVSAGRSHSCGIRTDRIIECWGDKSYFSNYSGQRVQWQDPQGRFTAVSAGGELSCGIRTDHTVECWGNRIRFDSVLGWVQWQVNPQVRFTAVSTGDVNSCGIRSDGTIQCWGSDAFRGDTTDYSVLLDAPTGLFTSVAVGFLHACGLRTDSTIQCWGNNGRLRPVGEFQLEYEHIGSLDAPTGRFTAISAGGRHACGLRADGTIQCWGSNLRGQLDAPGASATSGRISSPRKTSNRRDSTDGERDTSNSPSTA